VQPKLGQMRVMTLAASMSMIAKHTAACRRRALAPCNNRLAAPKSSAMSAPCHKKVRQSPAQLEG
jgi:hypothetical protein